MSNTLLWITLNILSLCVCGGMYIYYHRHNSANRSAHPLSCLYILNTYTTVPQRLYSISPVKPTLYPCHSLYVYQRSIVLATLVLLTHCIQELIVFNVYIFYAQNVSRFISLKREVSRLWRNKPLFFIS